MEESRLHISFPVILWKCRNGSRICDWNFTYSIWHSGNSGKYFDTDRIIFRKSWDYGKIKSGDQSLTRLLNKEYHMKESEKARSTVEVSTVSQPVAGYLRMNEGEPVMILASYINNEKEEPLYISYEIIAGSRYKISI